MYGSCHATQLFGHRWTDHHMLRTPTIVQHNNGISTKCQVPRCKHDSGWRRQGQQTNRFVAFCTFVLFVCLSVCLFACLLACLLACLFVCLFVCLLVRSFVRSFDSFVRSLARSLACLLACVLAFAYFLTICLSTGPKPKPGQKGSKLKGGMYLASAIWFPLQLRTAALVAGTVRSLRLAVLAFF